MGTLIFYGIVIIGGILAVTSLIAAHDHKIANARDDYWEPQLKQQTAATNMAVDASRQNLQTIHDISQQAQECSSKVTKYEESGKKMQEAADAKLRAANRKLVNTETDRATYETLAGQLSQAGASCEQKLSTVRDTLSGIGDIRMRDHPNDTSGDQGRSPATGQGASSGPVLKVGPN